MSRDAQCGDFFWHGELAVWKIQELMHFAAKDELRLRRNAVAVADLEKHLIEAGNLAAGVLAQLCRQRMGELWIGKALHGAEISGRTVAGETLNVVLSVASRQVGHQGVDGSLFGGSGGVLVRIKAWFSASGMFVSHPLSVQEQAGE